jgi:hypothetical protein
MKYQKIAIWRAFLPKTLNSFHPHSAYPPTCTRRAHFTFPCPCPSQGRTNTLLPTRPPRAEKTQNPAVPTRDREGGGGGQQAAAPGWAWLQRSVVSPSQGHTRERRHRSSSCRALDETGDAHPRRPRMACLMRKAMRADGWPIDGWMDGMGDWQRQAPLPATTCW